MPAHASCLIKVFLWNIKHPGDLMFHQKLCLRHDAWVGALLWWSCQSPGAHSCGLLNHPNGFHRGMFKLNAKSDADVLLYSLSHFEVMATQYTCSLNGVYRPHWLVQWSHHCSCMHIPVRSPWLPGYIDVVQTIVIILTMAGPLPDRPCISKITSVVFLKCFWHIILISLIFKMYKCNKSQYM